MTTVIGDSRVSSLDQAESEVSLAAQRHRIQAYCDAHGLALIRIEEDAGISARKTTKGDGKSRTTMLIKGPRPAARR